MRQPTMSTTKPIDDAGRPLTPAPSEPTPRPRLELPPLALVDYDPWADSIDPRTLTQAGLEAVPDHELAPYEWFRLPDPTRAWLGGLCIALLAELPPPPREDKNKRYQRLAEVGRRVDLALMGGWRSREDLEANGLSAESVSRAARFWSDDPTARDTWHRHRMALNAIPGTHGMKLVKEVLSKLDGSHGVVAGLRAMRTRLDAQLAKLEQRLGGGVR